MPGLKLMQATVLKVQEVFKKWAGGDNSLKIIQKFPTTVLSGLVLVPYITIH